MPDEEGVLAKLSNEYATIWLEVDRKDANGPRLKISSKREHDEIYLDPTALSLICHMDESVLALLADISRDGAARTQFHEWLQSVHGQLVLPEGLADRSSDEWAEP